jgi:uncharacterized cupin superfamily protein
MGWRSTSLEDVPSKAAPGFWNQWAREADYGEGWHSIGEHLGITGFGVNAYRADAGRELVVPHSETEFGGQEELYIITHGRARFTCDGEQVEIAAGQMLHVTHEVAREAVALEDGTTVLCVGGTPGAPYAPS